MDLLVARYRILPRSIAGALGASRAFPESLWFGCTGEAGSDVPPTAPLGTFPSSGYSYSASYSIYFVLNLADYYLYTGDKSFVEKEWPIVQRELAYNASNVNSQNLRSGAGVEAGNSFHMPSVVTPFLSQPSDRVHSRMDLGAFL
jgi:hypothetical protein